MARCHMIKAQRAGGINPLQSLFSDCLLRPLRPNLTTPSLPSLMFFFCCLIIPDCHYFSWFRAERRKRAQRKEERGKDVEINRQLPRRFKSLLRPR